MCKKILFIIAVSVLAAGCAHAPEQPDSVLSGMSKLGPFKNNERVLILAPHPDDETIGCAGVIQQAKASGAQVKITYLTNGDHNEIAFIVYTKRIPVRQKEFIRLGEVRAKESRKAMALLGIKEDDLIFLGYPDFGTFAIFSQYWHAKNPFKDLLTRISSVPYKDNFSFAAPYTGESILSDLKQILLDYKPDKIFVSHPADTNVDHKAFYLFLQIALADLYGEFPQPQVYYYLIHRSGWPLPRHYRPELYLTPPLEFKDGEMNWQEYSLTKEQLEHKHKAILCYNSQTRISAFYLLAFARRNELFGDYPEIRLEKETLVGGGVRFFSSFIRMFSESGAPEGQGSVQVEEGVSYGVEADNFIVRVEKEDGISQGFNFVLYIFGYSKDLPFASMPKIRIVNHYKDFRIFDRKAVVRSPGVSIDVTGSMLTMKIPLQVMGNPDFALISMRSYAGALPVDATGFRRIKIR